MDSGCGDFSTDSGSTQRCVTESVHHAREPATGSRG